MRHVIPGTTCTCTIMYWYYVRPCSSAHLPVLTGIFLPCPGAWTGTTVPCRPDSILILLDLWITDLDTASSYVGSCVTSKTDTTNLLVAVCQNFKVKTPSQFH